MAIMSRAADSDSNDSVQQGDSNAFINKLLVEMKSEFNKTDKRANTSSEDKKLDDTMTESASQTNGNLQLKEESNDQEESLAFIANLQSSVNETPIELKLEGTADTSESEDKQDIISHFKKPNTDSPVKAKPKLEGSPTGRRSLRNKSNSTEEKLDETSLKRSTRRRSKDCNESVLQSAIARKEKSYNESNKPQRLSRALKPTQKTLQNIALAKQEKARNEAKNDKTKSPKIGEKQKYYDSDSNNEVLNSDGLDEKSLNKGSNDKQGKKNYKRFKSNQDANKDSDSDHDSGASLNGTRKGVEKVNRRSQRVSTSRYKDLMEVDGPSEFEPMTADQYNHHPAIPESSSATEQLIDSRLCLCTQKTQLYPAPEESKDKAVVYCAAVDSVRGKLVGCSKLVERDTPLLRPSSRVPYALFCDVHKNRLIRHNCCPTCGVFCTQGRFTQCESRHQYHRDCQISVGDVQCCPHCRLSTPSYDVYITMHSPKKPVFLPTQRVQSTTNVTTG